jgi:hypothetical protein
MTVEVLPDGGVKITGTLQEVHTLAYTSEVALRNGVSHARFVTDEGVTEFMSRCRKRPLSEEDSFASR